MSKLAVPILEGRPCAYIGLQIGNLGKGMLRSFINVVLAPAFSELCTAFKSFTMKRKRKNLIEALFVLQNWEIDTRFFFFFCMDGTQNTLRKEKLVVGEVTNDDIIIPIVFRMSTQVVEVRGDVVCCLGFDQPIVGIPPVTWSGVISLWCSRWDTLEFGISVGHCG